MKTLPNACQAIALLGALTCLSLPAAARDFRVAQIPNGSRIGCAACHVSPAGGGPRNSFGLAVQAITGGANRPFWSATLAAADSDGDTFSNGVELGDPEGDFTVIPGWVPTNPGNPNSKPAPENQPPQFTSAPVTTAFQGEPYQYTATATDPEKGTLTFSKVAGPDWLNVSAAGLVSGTPPDLTSGEFTVTLRVTDNGSPAKSADQTYTLIVAASFAGWQALHFNLPAEADHAGALVDADNDGLPNLAEYALRLNPRAPDAPASVLPAFGAGGEINLWATVRSDDPKLVVQMEAAGDVTYAGPQTGTLSETTPAGAGLQTLRFTDVVTLPQAGNQRFWRIKLELKP
jgi:hypothetical protein